MVPLKYLSNFWRTLKMHLINCEISLQLKCFKNILFGWNCKQSKSETFVLGLLILC